MTAVELRRRARLILRWVGGVRGTSYWHRPQPIGRDFEPDAVSGYFNDLTSKTSYPGPRDDRGLPLNRLGDGRLVAIPTTVFQYGLGAWDQWLRTADPAWLASAGAAAAWARSAQDESGGWPIWSLLGIARPSRYSAMTQGQGISLLVRWARSSQDSGCLEAAQRAAHRLVAPAADGMSWMGPVGLVLEEVPAAPPNTILNGWIFALFGLRDLTLVMDDTAAEAALDSTLCALVAALPAFDAGWWSRYDASGSLASPFYHRLHIAQLLAVERSFPAHAAAIAPVRRRFEAYLASPPSVGAAVAAKAVQKLLHPPAVVLE